MGARHGFRRARLIRSAEGPPRDSRYRIPVPTMMTRLRERLEMVERQIARAGISDERVLEAMRAVPREEFYPPGFEDAAYRGGELPGWAAEALTEPLALATLLEGLSVGPRDRVLEV